MGALLNPPTRYNSAAQAGMYYARQRRRAAVLLNSLTPWSSGLAVTAGQYVSSEGGNTPWKATSSGTTGATAPNGQGVVNDGGVTWQRVDIQSLLTFLYTGIPTPA
jgi:hypothetical protein